METPEVKGLVGKRLTPNEARALESAAAARNQQEKYCTHLKQVVYQSEMAESECTFLLDQLGKYKSIQKVTIPFKTAIVEVVDISDAKRFIKEQLELYQVRIKGNKQKLQMAEEHYNRLQKHTTDLLTRHGLIFPEEKK